MTQKPNPTWEYFSKADSVASKAKCCACEKLLSLGSDKPSKQTIHGLKYHLEKFHKELHASYTEKVDARRTEVQEPPTKRARQDKTSFVQLSISSQLKYHS